jgi:hypothetical protein
MKIASFSIASSTLAFYQFLTIAAIGLLLLTLIKSYRLGFYDRIKNQGKLFVGFSIINELLAQGGYFFGIVAIAMVPVLSYYSSMGGFQGVFLLLLFLLFPLHERNRVTLAQGIGVILIGIGVYVVYTYG